MSARQAVATLMVSALVGAAACCPHPPPSTVERLGPSLLRLSSAVEAVVAYGGAPDGADERALLAAATKDDPGLLSSFTGYALHVQRQGAHAVVLVCDAEERRALLEDAGCTGALDRDATEGPASPCRSTLDAVALCDALP